MNMFSDKIWLDTLAFEHYGQWKADTQFTHLMGSGYLLACHTPGVPVEDARTRFSVSEAGIYRVWARARNWYGAYAPGRFSVKIDEKDSAELGALMTGEWAWQIAGDYELSAGVHTAALHDHTGYFGRCSSLVITSDMDYVPPRPVTEFEAERAACLGLSLVPEDAGEWDVLVAGGGPGGVPAAVAAARQGARTVLLTNRPLLGGNASEEAGVNFNGAAARQPNARDGGLMEEIARTKLYHSCSWTKALDLLCRAEKNLTVVYNRHVCGAEKTGSRITAAIARDTIMGTRSRYRAKAFIDCTGDSWLGYTAGAEYRIGREARWQSQEPFAPEQPDLLTMSGTLLNPRMEDTGKPVSYQAPEWVASLPAGKKFGRSIEKIGFIWWMEAPNILDDVYDAETARDELFRVYLAYFNYLKNLWDKKELAANYAFTFLNHIDAKRESRRLTGDYRLTQQDCMQGRDFPDTVGHAGWPIDLHHPKGIYSGEEGPFFSNMHVPLVKIPYRCLYSANIENLLMAGRNISVTHVALGTTRLQGTIANLGQAAGTAAALCVHKGITPRELGQTNLSSYRQLLLKNDQYIPGLRNEDPLDLARSATVSASSESHSEIWLDRIGWDGPVLPMDRQRASFLARGVSSTIPSVWLQLTNETDKPIEAKLHLRAQADPDGYTSDRDICVVTRPVPPGGEHWVEFPCHLMLEERYLWMWMDKTPGLGWRIIKHPALDWTRSERGGENETFENIRDETHSVCLQKPVRPLANCGAGNVTNGYSRPFSAQDYAWVSDPAQTLPQWLLLTFPESVKVDTVHLTFDTDMTNTPDYRPPYVCPAQLVTDYTVELLAEQGWKETVKVIGNYQRKRVHHFAPCFAKAVRITVTGSGDQRTARIFEVRLYREGQND